MSNVPRHGLAVDARAPLVLLGQRPNLVVERATTRAENRLQAARDVGRQADVAKLADVVEQLFRIDDVRHDLPNAPAARRHGLGQRQFLVDLGVPARHRPSLLVHVEVGTRNAECTGRHRLRDDGAHRVDLSRRRSAFLARLAHHVGAHGRVADECTDVHAELAANEVEVLGEGLPAPRHGGIEGRLLDVFDDLEHRDELRGALWLDRCQRQRAVADHHRGDTVLQRRCREAVPAQLRIEMGMDVDEAGADDAPGGVNDAFRRLHVVDDLAVADVKIAMGRGCARAVYDQAVPDCRACH